MQLINNKKNYIKYNCVFLLNVNIIKYHIYIIMSIAIEFIYLSYKPCLTIFRYNLSWNI